MIKCAKASVAALLIIPLAIAFCYKFGYACNITDSLPQKHFFIIKTKNIAVGDHILFAAPKSSAYAGMHLIKQVVGRAEDKINVLGRTVFVNQVLVGAAKPNTKTGQPLNIANPGVIADGCYFVATKHLDSYDSRYLEFGLVHDKDIIGVAYPLW